MLPDLQDTIVALSTAPGPGGRAIVRLSGPAALRIAGSCFRSSDEVLRDQRSCRAGELHLSGIGAPLPADLCFWPAPRTYTGQELVELHTFSCPPLVDRLIAQLLDAGARAAQPGEFTLRAFLSGKLDLTRAEAVLGVIEAGSRNELKHALSQLAGGITRPLQELRDDLLNLLADVEAGLDFADEDLQFVDADQLLLRLGKGLALVTNLGKQLDQRALGGRTFRVVLAGRPNVGKSSLFNALTGGAALVSPEPGTTRDYLVRRLDLGAVPVELVDTAGWQPSREAIGEQAQSLGKDQAEQADLVLLCLAAGEPIGEAEYRLLRQQWPAVVGVVTKCDLAPPPPDRLATSAVNQLGLGALKALLAERARGHAQTSLAPSLSRCQHHVEACLRHLRQAHATVIHEDPPELLALALREALEELGEMVGAVYTDDLLDRIFSRFCIGK